MREVSSKPDSVSTHFDSLWVFLSDNCIVDCIHPLFSVGLTPTDMQYSAGISAPVYHFHHLSFTVQRGYHWIVNMHAEMEKNIPILPFLTLSVFSSGCDVKAR